MLNSRAFLGVILSAVLGVAFSQTHDSKALDSASVAKSEFAPAAADPCAARARSGTEVEVWSDTRGVDFGPYMAQIVKNIRQSWYGVIPDSALPPTSTKGQVLVEFEIQKNGVIDKIKIDKESGDIELDRAAWKSLTISSPLPPLPEKFPGSELKLRFRYFYNIKPDAVGIYITPCVDVRARVGSTVQFSVPIGGIERAVVTWTVSGPGCDKMACGIISASGLYTAPTRVPNPPTVFVDATPQSNKSVPARVQLTVIPDGSSP